MNMAGDRSLGGRPGRPNRPERQEHSGDPDLARIAQFWNLYRQHAGGEQIAPEDVAIMQALMCLLLYDGRDQDKGRDALILAMEWLNLLDARALRGVTRRNTGV